MKGEDDHSPSAVPAIPGAGYFEWSLGNKIGKGVSGTVHATRSDGTRGIAKKAFILVHEHDRNSGVFGQGANERVASELARLIGLPVPTVALWTDATTGDHYSVSLRAFEQPLDWYEAGLVGILSPQFIGNCTKVLSLGYAFHTWICDTDHAAHGSNLLVNAKSTISQPDLAFIDHGYSMLRSWRLGIGQIVAPLTYYTSMPDIRRFLDGSVSAIEALSDDTIQDVVSNVPQAFLSSADAALITKTLIANRTTLRSFLSL